MNTALAPLSVIFALNTRLLENCLADVDEVLAAARPNQQTNSLAFIAAHLVDSRAWMARFVGLDEPRPFDGALDYGRSIEDLPALPTLAEIEDAWDEVSERLEGRLVWLSEDDLAGPASQRFPGVPETLLGGITFLIQHESYHIGQLALIRKYLGLPAMSYRLDGVAGATD
jgi:uncharacterized damage-inducible protein DinB